MARADDLAAALKAADAAGDLQAAQLLAAEIVRTRQGAPMGGARPLPANSWAITGKDPALSGAEAMLIGAGRTGDVVKEGFKQVGMGTKVAGSELMNRMGANINQGDALRALQSQEQQQAENTKIYGGLKKEFPIATGVGEALPALAIPMGVGGAATRVATPAIGMAAMEGMKYGTPEERILRAGIGGASGLAGGAISEGVSRFIMPFATPGSSAFQSTVKELSSKVGARPLPSQIIDSPSLARIEDMLANTPGGAGPMSAFVQSNRDAVNRTAASSMGEDTSKITADVLGGAKTRIGANFNALRQNSTMPSSQNVFDAIDDAKRIYLSKGDAKASGKAEALATLERLKDELYSTKQFSGDQYKAWVSDLRTQARGADNETVRAALKNVTKAMDAEAKANTSRTLDAQGNPVTWDDADRQWAALKTLLKPNAVNEVTGDVNPLAVRRAIAQQGRGSEKTGTMRGPLMDVGNYGAGVPQIRAGSPTASRESSDSLIGMMKAAPKWMAAKALTSPAMTEYLTRGLFANPEVSQQLSILAGKAAFPATGGYLDSYLMGLLSGAPVMAEH